VAVIVSLLLISVRYDFPKTTDSVFESMRQGIRFIRARQDMVLLFAVSFACTYLGIPLLTFLPVFVRDIFHGTVKTYTLFLSVQALGAIAGAVVVAALGRKTKLGRMALLGLLLLSVCVCGFAWSKSIVLSCVILFFGGMALVSCFAMLSSLVQLIAADNMRGRVMSIYNIAFRGGMPLGSLVAGALIPTFGAPTVVGAHGLILGALALYLLLVHRKLAAL
jgi:predicted MFS family arabinose efflux permease